MRECNQRLCREILGRIRANLLDMEIKRYVAEREGKKIQKFLKLSVCTATATRDYNKK